MYVYVLHVCNVIHANTYQYIQIHTYTYTYIHIHAMTWAGTLTHVRHAACRYTLDTCTYMHIYNYIHTYTYTYIHIHTPEIQCQKGVLCCCCCRTRLLCAAPPTQIRSDGAQDGISKQPLRVEGPWVAQGGCFGPHRRVQRARVRQNGSGNGSLIAG